MNLLTSSRVRRAAPRIISRSYEKLRRVEGVDFAGCAYDVPTDVEREVQSEIYMKGGVAVSISGAAAKAAAAAPRDTAAAGESDGASPRSDAAGADGYVELPGVANEVESYPCPICPSDKVFLTVAGLERHAREVHPERATSVDAHAARIQNEWRRRRIIGATGGGAGPSGDGAQINGPVILMPVSQNRLSEICRRCGYAVSADAPGAMDYHIEAHKKNDELRKQLAEEYGERFVEFVTCKQCTLVFADGRALFDHIRSNHKRKATGYNCRWCGKMFTGMTQLNAHKLQAHIVAAHGNAAPSYRQAQPPPPLSATVLENGSFSSPNHVGLERRSTANLEQHDASRTESPIDVDTFDETEEQSYRQAESAAQDVAAIAGPATTSVPDQVMLAQPSDYLHDANERILETLSKDARIDETAPCRTKCEICGLVMIKPSLLVRHMLRVHNQAEFVADVTSRHSAPLKFTVRTGGRVTWHCCDIDFVEREDILTHRQLRHGRGYLAASQPSADHIATTSTSAGYETDDAVVIEDDRRNLQHDGVPITGAEVFIESDPVGPSSALAADDEFERLFSEAGTMAKRATTALDVEVDGTGGEEPQVLTG